MKPSPEIEAIVRREVASRAEGRTNLNLFSESEDLWVVGSDAEEWYRGPQEVKPLTDVQVAEWGGHDSELLRLVAFEHGEAGWAAYEERRTYPSGRSSLFRRTLVLILENDAWRIVHSHFSAPVPNIEAIGVELTRTLSDLVDSIPEGAVDARAGAAGTTTLMFTDIVDSTPLAMAAGEAAWHELISHHFSALEDAVSAQGGSVVKTMGDGGMFVFASGSSALRAATTIQRVLASDLDNPLRVRIGVHTGDAMKTGDDYIGSAVAKAARVAAAASGGQILVSSTTSGLVSPADFEFGPPINVELKGLEGTHQLQPLVWA